MHSPWGLLALLAVPLIIVLYLLKQRHTDYTISSLYLWQNAVQDLEANAPWQKLRKNILMFLQILAVILLALILAEPFIQTGEDRKGAVMLVMDCSLSMQSADMKPSRFEAAKKDAGEWVEACEPGTSFSIIASGRTPYIVQHLVSDKNKVLQEIRNLQVTDAAADMEGTTELVDSLLRQNPGMQVHWFGDGTNPLPLEQVKYHTYNRDGNNYAITMLTQRKLQNRQGMTALSRIANYSRQDTELDVSLYADGRLFDARRIKVDAGGSESLYWQGIPEAVSQLECRIDTEDSLEKDNCAGETVYSNKTRKVLLVTGKNIFLEKVLTLLPNLELYRTTMEDIRELKGYDLYIFDGAIPGQLPEDGHCILFSPPANKYFSLAGQSEYPSIQPSQHELFNSLRQDMSFNAMKTDLYRLPEWGNPLMETAQGVAAFEGPMGRNRVMVFGFDLHETNLPVQPFFPILMTRAVEALIPGDMQELSSVYAGDSIELPIDPEAREVSVITPDGGKIRIAPPFPAAAFEETTKIGTYTLEQQLENETVQYRFYINAPSEKEFALSGQTIPAQQDRDRSESRKAPGGRNLKMLLLWLLLAILIVEWWFYTNGAAI